MHVCGALKNVVPGLNPGEPFYVPVTLSVPGEPYESYEGFIRDSLTSVSVQLTEEERLRYPVGTIKRGFIHIQSETVAALGRGFYKVQGTVEFHEELPADYVPPVGSDA